MESTELLALLSLALEKATNAVPIASRERQRQILDLIAGLLIMAGFAIRPGIPTQINKIQRDEALSRVRLDIDVLNDMCADVTETGGTH